MNANATILLPYMIFKQIIYSFLPKPHTIASEFNSEGKNFMIAFKELTTAIWSDVLPLSSGVSRIWNLTTEFSRVSMNARHSVVFGGTVTLYRRK